MLDKEDKVSNIELWKVKEATNMNKKIIKQNKTHKGTACFHTSIARLEQVASQASPCVFFPES